MEAEHGTVMHTVICLFDWIHTVVLRTFINKFLNTPPNITVFVQKCSYILRSKLTIFGPSLTYLLTPLSTVLLEKLTGFQLEIPRILCNSQVHYRIHNCPPPVPNLNQLDQIHTPASHFLKSHLNIFLPSTPGSPEWSLSLRFRHQNPVYAFPLPHTRYMPRPSNSSGFNRPNNTGWRK